MDSVLRPGTDTSLVTTHGVWTFGSAIASGGNAILLNTQRAAGGSAIALRVAQGGQVFAHSANGWWYEWQGSWQQVHGDPTRQ